MLMPNNIGEWISTGEGEYGLRCITGKVRISDVDEFLAVLKAIAHRYSVTIQAMDAELIAGEAHIKSAVQKALRAIRQGNSITSDLSMEVLLYAAGRRQIERALAMGVSTGDNKKIVVVIIDVDNKHKDLDAIAREIKQRIGLEEQPIEDLELESETETNTEEKRNKLMRFFNITDAEIEAVGERKLKMLVLERVALLEVYK
ncbi:MAG: hypothetical protein C4B56_05635 [Candidatus Methanophagaceae archaeon]|nr:MAG: hypothetical protein C4B56_05635 [Methanophagales archaeon]